MFENFTETAHAVSGPSWAGGAWCRPRGSRESRHRRMGRPRSLTVQCSAGDPGVNTSHVNTVWCEIQCSVRRERRNEEAPCVKIQFCFGRVPIHSWTWQIFFIINHMLARTQPAQLIAQRMFALWWEFEFWIEIGKIGSGHLNEEREAIDYSKKMAKPNLLFPLVSGHK